MSTSQALLHPVRRYPAQHPLAGLALRAVGVLPSGRVVWPIMGGSPDGEGDGADGDAAATAAAEAAKTAAADTDKAAADAATAKAAADKAAGEGKVEDLPDWAQKLLKDTRDEAGKARTDAKTKAADDARNEVAQTIGKALGLIKDEKTKVDPAELAKQVAEAQAAAKTTTIELAVFRAAGKHQGDPDALLDSRGFLAKLTDLDPADAKFQDKVDAAIKAAVDANPKLKATQAAGSSSADHGAGGSGEQQKRTPKSLADSVSGHYGT